MSNEEVALELINMDTLDKKQRSRLRKVLMRIGENGLQVNNMEKATFIFGKAFSSCLNAPQGPESKLKLIYFVANLLLSCHLISNSRQLGMNMLKVIQSRSLPPIENYRKQDQLLYNYYSGIYYTSDDQLEKAYKHLKTAFNLVNTSHPIALKILHKLLPLCLLKGEVPSKSLLLKCEPLQLYSLAIQSLKSGNLKNFQNFLAINQQFLIHQETLFLFEKMQYAVLRCLLKKSYSFIHVNEQVPIPLFKSILLFSTQQDIDTIQYYNWVSNLIERGYIRCNIYLEEDLIAFDPSNPFPSLKSIPFH